MQEKTSSLIMDLFLPNQCVICNRLNRFNLCSNCVSEIPNHPTLWINKNIKNQSLFAPKNHTRLQAPLENQYLNSIIACTNFKDRIVKKSIHYLKYKNLPQIANPLGAIMIRTLSQHLTNQNNIILCPIPLHPKRLKWRGYNQAQLLAEYIKRQLGFEIYTDLLKIKDTTSQMRIADRQSRIDNVNNAFMANKYCGPNSRAIIIDDVTTTLSTITQAAKALKSQGFRDINAIILAH